MCSPDHRLKPDGWDASFRTGVLTPHADVGPESELQAMAPAGVVIHAARVPFGAMGADGEMDPTIPLAPVHALSQPPHVDDAAELLAAAPLDTIAFGFTSSAYVIGAAGEEAMVARLERRTRGIPLVAASAATVDALRLLQARRIARDHVRCAPRVGERAGALSRRRQARRHRLRPALQPVRAAWPGGGGVMRSANDEEQT